MGWESARRYKPRPVGFSGVYVEKPPEPEPDLAWLPRLTPDDVVTIQRYSNALGGMALEDKRFVPNYTTFRKWDDETRLWWIAQIEQQARDGKDTIGVHVVTRAVMNRLD